MCGRDGTALLGDFGAATIYRSCGVAGTQGGSGGLHDHEAYDGCCDAEICTRLQQIEARAFGIFMLELLGKVQAGDERVESTKRIASLCASEKLDERLHFEAISAQLQLLIGKCEGEYQ